MTPLPGVPLSHVLDEVGSTLLTLASGRGRDPVVTGVAIHDPAEQDGGTPPRGALVLGVGIADAEQASALLAALGHAGAAGLVLRTHLPAEQVDAVADAAGVPVLVAAAVPWSQLVQLLRGVIDPATAGGGPGGHPLGDLFALSNGLAAALGGAVTIEDRASRVLAFSGNQAVADAARVATVLGRQVPAEWRDRLTAAGVFDRLYSSSEPIDVVLPVPGLHPRAAVAVRAGEEILGSIWATTDGPLDAEQRRTLVAAARTAALHILEERAVESAGRRRRAELTARLLDSGSPAADTARRLGMPSGPFAVVAARLDGGPGLAADRQAGLQRTADALGLHLAPVSPGVVTTVLDDTAYAVLPLAPPSTLRLPAPVRQTLERLAGRRDPPIAIGVSRPVDGPAGLGAARDDADAVLTVLPGRDPRTGLRVAELTDVWAQVVLAHLPVSARLRGYFRTGPLADVARYDAEHRTPLLESLRVHLESFGDVVGAAARLHVHPNTLRYRLRRIRELTGLDLEDADARLAVGLQLRLVTLPAQVPPHDPDEE
ncbi:DNA-binding PucR family transcriptional regulator [Pseudonocardia hierapolitana]|uniref:DNA-binding PucR family transcriptional regulator n=1 Tax=Pseudonocardia hierapolitana TaxID=1128676 RepID=A0A561T1U3_9PSEU|nr:PucR family transcriptional regulator [Pseudonocardia hierapolitana]TWF81076.1 DNA-binding PucR family transcriptional regulator [Pseudonocardia hierapolitana]